jgi:hypothetical protein
VNSYPLFNLRDLESESIRALGGGERKVWSRERSFLFRAFGVNIASDIFFPELEVAEGIPDVRIVLGNTPQGIPEAIVNANRYQAASNQFLLHVPKVGRYYVAGGKHIIVEPDPSAEPGTVRVFLLGTAFGALLLQRGVLPIHGSTVVINGKAVIIAGASGVGKSTLLAAFRNDGTAFLADDVAAVTRDEGNVPWVQPSYPQQKLWKDSADNMGMNVADCPVIRSGMDKYAIGAEEGFCRTPVRLAAICELSAENLPEAVMIPLAGPDKIAVLLRHTYRHSLLSGLGLKIENFQYCAAVAQQISACRLVRPKDGFSAMEQEQLIEELMAKLVSGQTALP